MDALRRFTIPIKGLKIGIHEYDFLVDDEFFSQFENTPIQRGTFEVKFLLDIREDMLLLTFDFVGSIKTECDRCLANIDLPMEGDEDLIVKYADEAEEEDEVVYIERGTSELNIAKYLYEYICLAMPVTNVYNCEDEEENVCDLEMLNYLDKKSVTSKDESEEKSAEEKPNSPWDELKNFNKN